MEKLRKQWLEERRKGIGGSDAASILGLNPHRTNLELWREKTGLVIPEDRQSEVMRYGSDMEAPLRRIFELNHREYTIKHTPYELRRHPHYDYLIGSLDGEITDESGKRGVLELKTATINTYNCVQWKGRLPDQYYVQLLHYLLITGYSFGLVLAILRYPGYSVLREYRLERKEDEIEYLLGKEIVFWRFVVENQEPPLILPKISFNN